MSQSLMSTRPEGYQLSFSEWAGSAASRTGCGSFQAASCDVTLFQTQSGVCPHLRLKWGLSQTRVEHRQSHWHTSRSWSSRSQSSVASAAQSTLYALPSHCVASQYKVRHAEMSLLIRFHLSPLPFSRCHVQAPWTHRPAISASHL